MHTGWRRRKRLSYRARIIQLMDEAIVREGGVTELSQEEIRWVCVQNGTYCVYSSIRCHN